MPNNSLTPQSKQPKFSVAIQTDAYKQLINNTLQDPKRVARFVASISSAVAVNPTLQECDAGTILSGALLGEALNLSPSPQLGQYSLVPYNDTKRGMKVAQFQVGYKGYIQLAIRTGQYRDLDAIEVRQGEYKGRDTSTGKPTFEFFNDDDVRDGLPVVGYLAYFELLNGYKKSVYFSEKKMLAHADRYSKAFNRDIFEKIVEGKIPASEMWKYSSPWYDGFEGMALKTVIRQLISKWGIMSIEMQDAIEKDMGVIGADGKVQFVDNEPPALSAPQTAPAAEALPGASEGDPFAD